MNRVLRWTWLPLFVFLIAPAFAADDKKDDKKPDAKPGAEKKDDKTPPKVPGKVAPKVPDKKEAENKLIRAGELAGEIVHIEPGKNAIRLKVTLRYSEVNQGALNGLRQAQIDLARARDYNAVVNARNAIAQHQANLYTMKSKTTDVPVDAAENVQVRLAQPKAAFDDMGNVKKYTAKELAKIRGKDGLYDGEFSDLSTGQLVRVTLVRPKTAPVRPRNKDDINLEDNKVTASRIIVLSQAAKP